MSPTGCVGSIADIGSVFVGSVGSITDVVVAVVVVVVVMSSHAKQTYSVPSGSSPDGPQSVAVPVSYFVTLQFFSV